MKCTIAQCLTAAALKLGRHGIWRYICALALKEVVFARECAARVISIGADSFGDFVNVEAVLASVMSVMSENVLVAFCRQ